MGDIELSLAFADNARSKPVMTDKVKPEGIKLITTVSGMSELAWRQFGFKEFQLSELSVSSLTIAISKGNDAFVGLPIFTSRSFFHTRILVRDGAGITDPSQLAGKRIGVPEYQQTAALWGRGVLLHEWGVDDKSVHWFMERLPERSHGGATGFDPKAIGIDLTYIPASSSIGQMLLNDELDATLLYIADPNFVDRSTAVFGPGSGVSPLFPDARAEATRYYSKTHLMPINHGAVVRRDVLEKYPWVALNIYQAFLDAKRIAHAETLRELEKMVDFNQLSADDAEKMSKDPFPYGVVANREVLEALTLYSYEQGLSARKVEVEELFYPACLEL